MPHNPSFRHMGSQVSLSAHMLLLTMRCLLVPAAAWLHLMCYAAWCTGYALGMLQARLLAFCFLNGWTGWIKLQHLRRHSRPKSNVPCFAENKLSA